MKIPYIRVKQKGEIFFVTKFKAGFLKEKINFHFRDPYLEFQGTESVEQVNEYIAKIERKGVSLKSESEGIQRRLQIERINDIKDYIQSSSSNFFPNSILLSVDVSKIEEFDKQYEVYEENETGYFTFPEETTFTVIDGQHRLAGLFISNEEIIQDFEIVAILLFNVSISTAAKLFADINGKQKAVNRSLIYDLYSQINVKELEEIKNFHVIAQKFYTDEKSPLFRQIKMLGIGKGAISQAFFIDYVMEAISDTDLVNTELQDIYTQLFYYFKAFQKVFPEDWPVPLEFKNLEELDLHAEEVLRGRKSQLLKTNGFGAIVRLFPEIYKRSDKSFTSYLEIVSKLKGNINWTYTDFQGTGKKMQNEIYGELRNVLHI
jgi:DGQHR domain-containing protein